LPAVLQHASVRCPAPARSAAQHPPPTPGPRTRFLSCRRIASRMSVVSGPLAPFPPERMQTIHWRIQLEQGECGALSVSEVPVERSTEPNPRTRATPSAGPEVRKRCRWRWASGRWPDRKTNPAGTIACIDTVSYIRSVKRDPRADLLDPHPGATQSPARVMSAHMQGVRSIEWLRSDLLVACSSSSAQIARA
jgi:hypothetical protein